MHLTLARTLSLSTFGLALVASGCSGGGGGGGGTVPANPPPIVVTRSFPQGDAIAVGGGTAWDIVSVTKTFTGQFFGGGGKYDTMRVDVTFAQDISNALPAPGQALSSPTQLGVIVGIDSDGNPATGSTRGCPTTPGTPLEYVTSSGGPGTSRLSDGNYSIFSDNSAPIASEAQATVSGRTFSETFFLESINGVNGQAPPVVKVIVAALNGADSTKLTDCVPTDASEI